MKRICRMLSIAALAVVGTLACTELNKIPGQAGNGAGAVTLTTSVSLDETPGTRALDATGRKTFAENDKIAIIYKDTDNKTIKVVNTIQAADISSGGKRARFTVTLTKPKPEGNLRLIYPAAMAKETIAEGADITDGNTVKFAALNAQDGVLATLAKNFDLTTFDGQFTSDGQLPALASLTNRLAILELTAKDDSGTPIPLSSLMSLEISVGDDTGNYTDIYKVEHPASWPVYVAVKPVTEDTAITLTVTFTDGTTSSKTVDGKLLEAGNLYPVTVKMQRIVNLASLTSDFEAQHGDVLTGTLNGETQKYKISIAAGATVTLRDATINGVHTDDSHELWAGLTCLGDATIILEGTNAVQNFNDDYPGLQPGTTGTTLTIRGSGSLTATGRIFGAGIGTKYNGSCGHILIVGGTVRATSGYSGAGIGSGSGYGGTSQCGDISISGSAEVTANGGGNGAGIGTGYCGKCGNISISGSVKVTANGGGNGAGIGTGLCGTCGNISISGGTVTAKGGNSATGIGTGRGNSSKKAECGNISITRGTGFVSVTAIRGGDASKSIGTHKGFNNDQSKCGSIKFDVEEIFDGNDNGNYGTPGDNDYGGLHFAKTTTDDGDDDTNDTDNTWTLTPKPQ